MYTRYHNYGEVFKSTLYISTLSSKLTTPVNNNFELSINYKFMNILYKKGPALSNFGSKTPYLVAFQNVTLPIYYLTYNNLLYLHYSLLTYNYFSLYTGYVVKTPFTWLNQGFKLNPVTNTFYLKVYSS